MTADPRTLTPRQHLDAEKDWETLRVKLKAYAWKATGQRSWERAEDLAQDTIAEAYAKCRWDPATEPNLFRYLTVVLRGILFNDRRLKRNSSEIVTDDGDLDPFADSPASTPEAIAIRRQRVERIFAALERQFAKDALGAKLTACFSMGVESAANQVVATGESLADVRRARRRVFHALDAIQRAGHGMELH